MRNAFLYLVISLLLCTYGLLGCSNEEDNSMPNSDEEHNITPSVLSMGTSALKNNTFQANIATFSRGALGVCYSGTDIFLVSSNEHTTNQCIQPDELLKHTYLLISVSKFDNGEFEISKTGVYQEIIHTKNTANIANVVYIDDSNTKRENYQALSGHVVLSGITEKSADAWKQNSGVSIELKGVVFYDYPKYEITCSTTAENTESCTCKGEDNNHFKCDPETLYDETKLQTFTYQRKFELIPCENLKNVPEVDPKCESL